MYIQATTAFYFYFLEFCYLTIGTAILMFRPYIMQSTEPKTHAVLVGILLNQFYSVAVPFITFMGMLSTVAYYVYFTRMRCALCLHLLKPIECTSFLAVQ